MPNVNDVIHVPEIRARIEYLNEALQFTKTDDHKKYVASLLLFSILIENVSLFSQFAIVLSFTRFSGLMKKVSNIIAWTSVDEQMHANAGLFLIHRIKQEHPEFFDEDNTAFIYDMVYKSLEMEEKILDWIYAEGALPKVPKQDLLDFMKLRVNESLAKLGMKKPFEVITNGRRPLMWFEEEVFAMDLPDFFDRKDTGYSKHHEPINEFSIFQ